MSDTVGKLVKIDSGDGKTVYTGIHIGDEGNYSKILVSTKGTTDYKVGELVACPKKWVKKA